MSTMFQSHKRHANGFTLIELMITLAVVAIISAIAIPSYNEYVQRAARADAKATMGQVRQFMERFYSMNNAYDARLDGAAVALPAGMDQSPQGNGPKRYTIALTNLTPGGYTITATPHAGQTSDSCGVLSISNTGARTAGTLSDPAAIAKCWR